MEQRIAGRELDAEIAARVMGHTWDESRCRICGWPAYDTTAEGCVADNCSMRPLPKRRADEPAHYSTDITAAWRVVESRPLGEWSWQCSLDDSGQWWAEIRLGYQTSYREAFPCRADTLPLAICLAALATVNAD